MKSDVEKGALRDALLNLERIDPTDSTEDVASIIAESSFTESMLIGTPRSLLAVARELLRVVAAFQNPASSSSLEDGNIVSHGERLSDSIKRVFDEDGDVWPVCVCIVPNEHVQKAVIDAIRS